MTPGRDTRILLIRHGRTALNAQDRLRGLADPPLDETGADQAAAVALSLRDQGLEYVVSSPLARAVRTAQIIAEACGVPRDIDPGFNDRDYGPWTGRPRAEVVARWGSVDAAPGVEPLEAVRSRALDALALLTAAPAGYRAIGVVTHDAVIRPLLDAIQPGIRVTVPTASWADVELVSGVWRVRSTDNLAPGAAPD